MYENAIKLLNKIKNFGYTSYIVGGFPRDKYLNKETNDIDICTDATPMELHSIFKDIVTTSEYGSVVVLYHGYKYEITTFRKEYNYKDNRHPSKVEYVNTLKEDIKRRDFTINTLAIDCNENLIDLLNGKKDIDNKLIKTVGPAKIKIKEDALRILRAIRFATVLNFNLEQSLKYYIKKYGHLLKRLSNDIKKSELDIIFSSPNKEYGIKLIIDLKLATYLDIPNIKNIRITPSLITTWAELNVLDKYNFTAPEKEAILKINELKGKNILNKHVLYEYGLYACTLTAELLNVDKTKLNEVFTLLPIKSKNDIEITPVEICEILNKEAGPFLKDIIKDLEDKIIDGKIENNKETLTKYIKEKY